MAGMSEQSARSTLSTLVATTDVGALRAAIQGDEGAVPGVKSNQVGRIVEGIGADAALSMLDALAERAEAPVEAQVVEQTGLQDVGAGEGDRPEGPQRGTPERRQREAGQMDIETAAATERLETGVGPAGRERTEPTEIEGDRREPETGEAVGLGAFDEETGQIDDFEDDDQDGGSVWTPSGDGYNVRGANSARIAVDQETNAAGQPKAGNNTVRLVGPRGTDEYVVAEHVGFSEAQTLTNRLSNAVTPAMIGQGGDRLADALANVEGVDQQYIDAITTNVEASDDRDDDRRTGGAGGQASLGDVGAGGQTSLAGPGMTGDDRDDEGNGGGDDGGRAAEPSGLGAFEGEGVDRPDAETVAERIRSRATTDPTEIEDCDAVAETLAAAMEAVAEGAPARREQVGDDPMTDALGDVRQAARSAMGDHHCLSAGSRHRFFNEYRRVDRAVPATPGRIEGIAEEAAEWYADPTHSPDPHHSFRELAAEVSELDPPDPPGSGRQACASLWDWWGWRSGPVQIVSHFEEAREIAEQRQGSVYGRATDLKRAWGEFSREFLRKVDDAGCLDKDPDFSIDDLRKGLGRVAQDMTRSAAGDVEAAVKDVDRLIRNIQLSPPERVGNQTIPPWDEPDEPPDEPDTARATPDWGPITTVDVTVPVAGDDAGGRNAGQAFSIMLDGNGNVTDRRASSTTPPTQADIRDRAVEVVAAIIDETRAIGAWYPKRFPVDVARAYPVRGDGDVLHSIHVKRGVPVNTDVARSDAVNSTDDLDLSMVDALDDDQDDETFVDEDVGDQDDDPFGPSIGGAALEGQADLEGGHAEEEWEPGPIDKLERIDRPEELAGWVEDDRAAGHLPGGVGNIVYRGPSVGDGEHEMVRIFVSMTHPTTYPVDVFEADPDEMGAIAPVNTLVEPQTPGEAWDTASEYMRGHPVNGNGNENVNVNGNGGQVEFSFQDALDTLGDLVDTGQQRRTADAEISRFLNNAGLDANVWSNSLSMAVFQRGLDADRIRDRIEDEMDDLGIDADVQDYADALVRFTRTWGGPN